MTQVLNVEIETLGRCTIDSPLQLNSDPHDGEFDWVEDSERVLHSARLEHVRATIERGLVPPSFEVAGPRQKIYFDASKVRAAIVTCGGLCPGLNDVVRALVMGLWYHYGVRRIYGVRYGYHGLLPAAGHPVMDLTPEVVQDIHTEGGSVLGSSRGGADVPAIVDALERMSVGILFTIGGDGTQRGAFAIHQEAQRRGLKLAVVGIPKTIDNDIAIVERSFGFETAFSLAVDALAAANVEAEGAHNCVGIVKLMGRHSGFIAAHAALALNVANFVLIPEVKADLRGPNGFLEHLIARIQRRHHAVVCVAEGAGQDWTNEESREGRRDASGNVKLSDVGMFLKQAISSELTALGMEHSVRYIDPSYMIRAAPANASDSMFCAQLGHNAVHAAMAGKTGILIGRWHGQFTHVPLSAIINRNNRVVPSGQLWWSVLEATGQPRDMTNPK